MHNTTFMKTKKTILLLSCFVLCVLGIAVTAWGKSVSSEQSSLPNAYRWIVGEWRSFDYYPGEAIIMPDYIQYETDGESSISQKHKYSVEDSYIVVDGKQVFSLDEENKSISYDYITEGEGEDGPVNNVYTVEFTKTRNILLDDAVIRVSDYDFVDEFNNGVALVIKGDRCGLINSKNQLIVPCVYSYLAVNQCADDLIPAVDPMHFMGYIDLSGRVAIPFIYDDNAESDFGPAMFKNGYALASKDGKWGVIDKTGKEVIPFKYGSIYNTNVGLYGVFPVGDYSSGNVGFIDINDKMVIPCVYKCWCSKYDDGVPSWYFTFSDGVIALSKDGKYGCVNTKGETVLPFEYDYIGDFYDGKARAVKNGEDWIVCTSSKGVEAKKNQGR